MLKISRLTDYAVVMLSSLDSVGSSVAASDLAQRTSLPQTTVAKILKRLAQQGLVLSQRGAAGGYALARPLAQIGIDEVIAAIDGPIRLTACVTHKASSSTCQASGHCALSGRWGVVNAAVTAALANVSLAQLAGTAR